MTATAFAFDQPSLDPAAFDQPAVFDQLAFDAAAFDLIVDEPARSGRPHLRIIEGEGRATDAAALAPAGSPMVSVETYRRRRFFALLAVTAMVLVAAWAAGISVTGFTTTTAPNTATAQPSVHVVAPGDSYGAIAAEFGAADPVGAGAQLRAANGGGELVVGQRLVIEPADLD